jgi:hypothetical protein
VIVREREKRTTKKKKKHNNVTPLFLFSRTTNAALSTIEKGKRESNNSKDCI